MQEKENSVTRRGFLRGVASAGAGLALAAAAPPASAQDVPKQDVPKVEGRPVPQPFVDAQVHLNQVGFLPQEPKRAVITATGPIHGSRFVLVDDDVIPTVRFAGALTPCEKAGAVPVAGVRYPHHFFADFDGFQRPGRYRLRLSDGHLSAPFSVGADIYERLVPLILNYFDVQRCGPQHSAHQGPCHLDDGVLKGGPRDGEPFDASGGWHDAGDYLKFVETTSYVTAVMLFAYDHYRSRYEKTLPTQERGTLPLQLKYARVGLDWLLKMHPRPDEFYFQVGDDTDHDSWRLPERDSFPADAKWKPRPVHYGIGANLAGRCAAAFAMAFRLYRPYDAAYAARCLRAAESVYALGLKHPQVVTTLPADFYPETTWRDDMEWGAIDLYKATGKREYLAQAHQFAREAGPAETYTSVYNVHAMAHATLYPYSDAAQRARLLEHLRVDAEDIRARSEAGPYGLGTDYVWGTAEAAAGAAITCTAYAHLSGDHAYLDIARRQRDFILGCNPFGLCCLIGAGTRYPLFPHHQIANLKNIELTGALVGGPCSAKEFASQHISLSRPDFRAQQESPAPADDIAPTVAVYHDVVQDYVTNEPANDYTAKFLLLTAYSIMP